MGGRVRPFPNDAAGRRWGIRCAAVFRVGSARRGVWVSRSRHYLGPFPRPVGFVTADGEGNNAPTGRALGIFTHAVTNFCRGTLPSEVPGGGIGPTAHPPGDLESLSFHKIQTASKGGKTKSLRVCPVCLAKLLHANSRYLALVILAIVVVGYPAWWHGAQGRSCHHTLVPQKFPRIFSPGASPPRVEALVTKPMVDALREEPDVMEVDTSAAGVSPLFVEVDYRGPPGRLPGDPGELETL
ncbi:MAG: hypothetical protein CM15mP103_09710 [Gammaproteobacteria bacterium]|nr:MAG: hypothetical protein CM15mP103_09710 [Gammaproteobacteria bacterium]